MGGKVIHISDAMHTRLRSHCDAGGISMRQYVEELLTDALDGLTARSQERPEPRQEREVVRKKPLPPIEPETGDEPWTRPPFWATQRRSA